MILAFDKANGFSPLLKNKQINVTPILVKRTKLDDLTNLNQNANDIKKNIGSGYKQYRHRQSSTNDEFYTNFLKRIREDPNQVKNSKEITSTNALNQSNNKATTSLLQKTKSVLNQFNNVKRVSISKKDKISNNITIISKKSEQLSQNKRHSPTHGKREGNDENLGPSFSIDVSHKKSPKRESIIKQGDQDIGVSPMDICLKTNSFKKEKSTKSTCFMCCMPIKD